MCMKNQVYDFGHAFTLFNMPYSEICPHHKIDFGSRLELFGFIWSFISEFYDTLSSYFYSSETTGCHSLKTAAHVGYGLTIFILVAVLTAVIIRYRRKKYEGLYFLS